MTTHADKQRAVRLTAVDRARDAEQAGRAVTALIQLIVADGKPLVSSDVEEQRVRSTQSVSKPKDWEVSLVTGVARAFGCLVLWESGRSQDADFWGKYHVVGQHDCVRGAEFCIVAMLKLANRERVHLRRGLSSQGATRSASMTSDLDDQCSTWVDAVLAQLPKAVPHRSRELSRAVRGKMVELTRRSGLARVGRARRSTYQISRPRVSR